MLTYSDTLTYIHTFADTRADSDHGAPYILTSYEDYTDEDDGSDEEREGEDAGLPQLRTVVRRWGVGRGWEGSRVGDCGTGWSAVDRTHACACVHVSV